MDQHVLEIQRLKYSTFVNPNLGCGYKSRAFKQLLSCFLSVLYGKLKKHLAFWFPIKITLEMKKT